MCVCVGGEGGGEGGKGGGRWREEREGRRGYLLWQLGVWECDGSELREHDKRGLHFILDLLHPTIEASLHPNS